MIVKMTKLVLLSDCESGICEYTRIANYVFDTYSFISIIAITEWQEAY